MQSFPEPDGALTSKQRDKLVAGIEKKIDALKTKLEKTADPKYFSMVNGVIDHDKRAEFIKEWRATQSRCNEKVGPNGMALRESPKAEQEAYRKLSIHKQVNQFSGEPASQNAMNVWPAAWPKRA